mgnify:CR=1 FL=1
MKNRPIVLIAGEPYSIFYEIFLKSLKNKKIKKIRSPIILIGSKKLLEDQINFYNYKFYINQIDKNFSKIIKYKNNQINIINVNFNYKKIFDKISNKSNNYINQCCDIAIDLVKNRKVKVLINGPISKKNFLKKKYAGMTEYFASKTGNKNKEVMLIYNNILSVSPITTHLPLKKIFSKITKKKIINNIKTINNFYIKYLKKKPKIALTGMNPHCESFENKSEEDKIISPAIKQLKKSKIIVSGPFPADTIFLEKNYKKFNVIVGMYHDQVLTPIKTIYGFDAINITLGLPFLRITPDHGPNESMLGKNKSSANSLINALLFTNKIK